MTPLHVLLQLLIGDESATTLLERADQLTGKRLLVFLVLLLTLSVHAQLLAAQFEHRLSLRCASTTDVS